MVINVTSMMVTSIGSGTGSGGIRMSKSEVSEMEHAQLGNPSMSGSADHTGFKHEPFQRMNNEQLGLQEDKIAVVIRTRAMVGMM
jgi:hypothetical protein